MKDYKQSRSCRWRTVCVALLMLVQVALLGTATARWRASRSNTLFDSGHWIIGKDTGKFLFYTYEFMFAPLTEGFVELSSCMGFQEILYHQPEDASRSLETLACEASMADGAYLWLECRKQGQRMLGCRVSRHPDYPSGFYRYGAEGALISVTPLKQVVPISDDGWHELSLTRRRGAWTLSIDGVEAGGTPTQKHTGGHMGFKGSGWNRRPCKLRNVCITFSDPQHTDRSWVERERFDSESGGVMVLLYTFLFAAMALCVRLWRNHLLGRLARVVNLSAYVGRSALISILLLATLYIFPRHLLGLTIPGVLCLDELCTIVLLVRFRQNPTRMNAAISRSALTYSLLVLILSGGAIQKHGRWLTRAQYAVRARLESRDLSTVQVLPDSSAKRTPFHLTQPQVVSPGSALFTVGHAYREQRIGVAFDLQDRTTLDLVFQQQSFHTAGDPVGEQLPLQRRLVRITTHADVPMGLASQVGNRPAPFLPLKGQARTGSNQLEVISSERGLEITLNGARSRFRSARPLERGETGLMSYGGPVTVSRFDVRPTDGAVLQSRGRTGLLILILVGAMAVARSRRTVQRLIHFETIALYPLFFYFLGTLYLSTEEITSLGFARAGWFDLACAAGCLGQVLALFVFAVRPRTRVLLFNVAIVAATFLVTLCVWDRLPAEHPLRITFSRDAILPAAQADTRETGPWFAVNRLVGAHTYTWRQRLGGEAITPEKPEGSLRCFVVGGSQAWGSGAASSGETFAEQLEDALNVLGCPVEVFNAAANGGGVEQSLTIYRELLRQFKPDILIADVGLNECTGLRAIDDPAERNRHIALQTAFMDRLLELCREDNVDAILVLEPMCNETPLQPVDAFYEALSLTALRHYTPVLSPLAITRQQETDHFVWWDTAHLAPYGQRLLADLLTDEVHRLVKIRLADPQATEGTIETSTRAKEL